MTYLTTGYPLLDLAIALAIGYFLAWFFLARPLSHRAEEDISRTIETDTELLTSHRELNRVRDEVKEMKTKAASDKVTIHTTTNQLVQAQNDLHTVLEEKRAMTTELEARSALVAQLQGEAEKHDLDAQMAVAQLESLKLKANLAIVTAENDSMKARISVLNMENQLLRTPANVPAQQEMPSPNFSTSSRPSQDASVSNNQWLQSNLTVDTNQPVTPQFVPQPNGPESQQAASEQS
jgi:hypothetical protein